ncbi:Mucin-17 like [Heracleum sosnowskyi]|uniref:Mucin-17 like n=1 Tax=Heracleum sosnowskyi TaxID=360622 RepID=A0AAD8HGA2_9APIA|nr:Mucin-17 like [Heracleum sosnowskyi]
MKVRNKGKGKVHPSPSAHSLSPAEDIFSILKLLPATILVLVSVLSLQDREVLAFLITRSLKSATPSSQITEKKNKEETKLLPENQHKILAFDCDCFNCYTSYWYKWDSSSNREIITQAIEAFDEDLNNDEQFKKSNRVKKKDKMGRRQLAGKSIVLPEISPVEKEAENISGSESHFVKVGPEKAVEITPEAEPEIVVRSSTENAHKGLARKVLPDIMGLLNSRLWNLWSPNV